MSRTTIRRVLSTVTALGVIAPALALVTSTPAAAATGTDIVGLANDNYGEHYCDTNSLGGRGFGSSCNGENWCSDFAKWVWQNVGIDVAGLTPESGSFYTYGSNRGTLHTDAGYVPQPGDAVVYNYHGRGDADHVGLVTQVFTDGNIQVINGNFGGSGPTSSSVKYSFGPGHVGANIAGQTVSAFVTASGLTLPPPPKVLTRRIGVLQGGHLIVKEGGLSDDWTPEADDVAKFEIAGDRIGILRTNGTLAVKEGGVSTGWNEETNGISDFRLAGDRIGILRNDGSVAVKEGDLQAGWAEETNGVKQIALAGDRIGILRNDGTAAVKEGNLATEWAEETNGVAALELDGGRIGVLRTDGSVAVKEGGLKAFWDEETNGVKQLVLAGDRIGVLRTDGSVAVKEGDLQAGWDEETNGIKQVALAGDRIGILRNDGSVAVKEGDLQAGWAEETNGANEVRLTDFWH